MSIFIRERNGKYYLVTRVKIEKRWKEKWTPLQDKDLEILTKALQIKEEISKQIVEVPCANPYCKNTIKMTLTQKRDFLIKFKKKYDKVVLVCCSKECQQNRIDVLCISGLSRRQWKNRSVGAYMEAKIVEMIDKQWGGWAPLDPKTVRRKKSTKAWVDTGELCSLITHVVEGRIPKVVKVGIFEHEKGLIAHFLEFGTKHIPERPLFRLVFDLEKEKVIEMII